MKVEDAGDMYEYACQSEVTKYLTWSPHPSREYTRDYLAYVQKQYEDGEYYDWALIFKDEMKMIGTCGFTSFDDENNAGEIGYVLNPDYWGRGLAAEAVREVLKFGFQRLNLHRIEAKHIEGNNQSRRVMEKCGMSYEGTHRSSMYIKGEYRTICICAILREEYLQGAEEPRSSLFRKT